MVPEVTILNEKTAEMTVSAGCPVCGGDLKLRVSPDGARTYCAACRLISRPRVGFGAGGLVVLPVPLVQA